MQLFSIWVGNHHAVGMPAFYRKLYDGGISTSAALFCLRDPVVAEKMATLGNVIGDAFIVWTFWSPKRHISQLVQNEYN